MDGRGAEDPGRPGAEELPPLPRGFVVFAVAFAIYLAYRLYQGIDWALSALR